MGRIFELYSPIALAIIVAVLSWVYYPFGINPQNILDEFRDIGAFVFGFLLTLLALLLQSNNQIIKNFRERHGILYKRLIRLNRNAVYTSFLLTIYAYCISNFNVWDGCPTILNKILFGIFAGGFTYFFLISIYFLRIFYKFAELES